MVKTPLKLGHPAFQQYRASFQFGWIDAGDVAPDDDELADSIREEHGFLMDFPETHLQHYIEQGHAGHIALDISQQFVNEIEAVFTFWDAEPRVRTPRPERKYCDLTEIANALSSLVSDSYLRPPSVHPVDLELTFEISRDQLPPRGLVSAMLGLATRVRDKEMVLTGTQMAIGGELTETISWYLSHPQLVSGVIRSQTRRQLSDTFLIDGLDSLAQRFQRLVLEQE